MKEDVDKGNICIQHQFCLIYFNLIWLSNYKHHLQILNRGPAPYYGNSDNEDRSY